MTTQIATRAAESNANERKLRVGSRVRVERDETLYPSRGTWPQFRGKTGTVVEVNRAGRGPTEYGVGFGKATRASAWFKAYELRLCQ